MTMVVKPCIKCGRDFAVGGIWALVIKICPSCQWQPKVWTIKEDSYLVRNDEEMKHFN